jgi:hypothetical protein
MTADDFYLLFIAFGSFVILALALWGFARFADRKQDARRGPDIRHDVDSPGSPDARGRKQAVRSNGTNDVLRLKARLLDHIVRCRIPRPPDPVSNRIKSFT